MAKITFDKDTIEGLEPPAGANRIDYAIDDVRGFAIQTTKAGSKRFMLVYVARESGRERRLVLGEMRALKFGNMVRPGEQLVMEVTIAAAEHFM